MNSLRDHFLPGACTVIQHSTQSWNGTLDYDGQETRHGSMIHGNVTGTFTFRATKCLVSPIWVNCPKNVLLPRANNKMLNTRCPSLFIVHWYRSCRLWSGQVRNSSNRFIKSWINIYCFPMFRAGDILPCLPTADPSTKVMVDSGTGLNSNSFRYSHVTVAQLKLMSLV